MMGAQNRTRWPRKTILTAFRFPEVFRHDARRHVDAPAFRAKPRAIETPPLHRTVQSMHAKTSWNRAPGPPSSTRPRSLHILYPSNPSESRVDFKRPYGQHLRAFTS